MIARALRAASGRPRTDLRWAIDRGPAFGNNIGVGTFDELAAILAVDQADLDDDGAPRLTTVMEAKL